MFHSILLLSVSLTSLSLSLSLSLSFVCVFFVVLFLLFLSRWSPKELLIYRAIHRLLSSP